jgi:hypothetical protein
MILSFIVALAFTWVHAQEPLGPVVQTKAVTDIGHTMANSGGNIPSDGGNFIISRGLVWGILPDPTTLVNIGIEGAGSGIGDFDVTMTGLNPGTTYYVRAFAVDATGTYYGNEEVFSTLPLSIEEAEKQVLFYPNPATDRIFIKIDEHSALECIIIDILGNELYTGEIAPSGIDISTLPVGTYLLTVKNEKEMLIHELFHKN